MTSSFSLGSMYVKWYAALLVGDALRSEDQWVS